MAAATGTGGAVTASSTTGAVIDANITSWSASFNADIHETTSWSVTGNAKTKVAGLYDVTGSFEGFAPVAASVPLSDFSGATGGNIALSHASGKTYTFDARFSNVSVTTPIGGLVTISANFQSNGAVTVA